MIRSTSLHGDFASSNKSNENKIEGVALLLKREIDGKKSFKCWRCNEYGHYASNYPKREKKFKGKFRSRRSRDLENTYMLMKKKNQIRVEVMMN